MVQAVGPSENLVVVNLDVTKPSDAESAVKAAVDRFDRIDVLVNNAGNFYAGFFEEIRPEDFRGTDRDQPVRLGKRHPRRAACHARSTLWPHRPDLIDRRNRRAGVRVGLRRVQVRRRRLDRVAFRGGGAVIVSRMCSMPHIHAVQRSMPMPKPA